MGMVIFFLWCHEIPFAVKWHFINKKWLWLGSWGWNRLITSCLKTYLQVSLRTYKVLPLWSHQTSASFSVNKQGRVVVEGHCLKSSARRETRRSLQWSALVPHSKKALGTIPRSPKGPPAFFHPSCLRISSSYSLKILSQVRGHACAGVFHQHVQSSGWNNRHSPDWLWLVVMIWAQWIHANGITAGPALF